MDCKVLIHKKIRPEEVSGLVLYFLFLFYFYCSELKVINRHFRMLFPVGPSCLDCMVCDDISSLIASEGA